MTYVAKSETCFGVRRQRRHTDVTRMTGTWAHPFRKSKQYCKFETKLYAQIELQLAIFIPIDDMPPPAVRKHGALSGNLQYCFDVR